MTEQTVGNGIEAVAEPTVETPAAQDKGPDLSELLNEFTQSTAPVTQPQPEPQKTTETAVDVEARKELASLRFDRDIKPVIATVRGDIPKEVFDDFEVQGWLDAKARKDPRLQKAWDNRESNPAAWGKVEKALSAEFAKKFQKLPDPNVTEDVAAVTAAVRGASKQAPPAQQPNLGKLSRAEFRKHVMETHGYDPGV
jgi:hypothetical protein